eukprot:TRINITY_DN80530_c0_g1_i1.p1 TRINITY_DN80530_c0_g1~~TRINITY_DN80530_c0_g1_i1.p1  ORF type:complete len:640 (-),score=112.49 TRINITY_DN80530_c0_g1_i1:154-1929(-)
MRRVGSAAPRLLRQWRSADGQLPRSARAAFPAACEGTKALRSAALVGGSVLVMAALRQASRSAVRQCPSVASGVQPRYRVTAAAAVAEAPPVEIVDPASVEEPDAPLVGDYSTIRSGQSGLRDFVPLACLGEAESPAMGSRIWVRARLATTRVKGKSSFIVLRQYGLSTVQAVKFKDKADGGESATAVAKFFKGLPLESVVDVCGTLVEANVTSCTQSKVELQIERAYCVSRSTPTLPFLMADAQRSEAEIEASLDTDRPYVRVLPDLRLDNRWLDLRVPANNGIMRVKAAVSRLFRQALTERGFVEIQSPKLLPGASEGGAEVFRTDYFGQPASLAQSPQIYKQMALSADLPGVFEIGSVFRAENSNTNRHLCDFTGADFEMPINWHYREVIEVVHATFKTIFKGLEEECADVLSTVRQMYPSTAPLITEEPCVVMWEEGMQMLKDHGIDRDPSEDLGTEEERILGQLVKEKYNTDIFFFAGYPSAVRPFYTMVSESAPETSNSYDLIFRGQEIGSGAQRCHDPALLEARCAELGVPTGPLQSYIDSFRHGVPPHGGIGLGLERIVQLYLGLDNIRKAALFTRDPTRLSP